MSLSRKRAKKASNAPYKPSMRSNEQQQQTATNTVMMTMIIVCNESSLLLNRSSFEIYCAIPLPTGD
jgi:hypothetical protein